MYSTHCTHSKLCTCSTLCTYSTQYKQTKGHTRHNPWRRCHDLLTEWLLRCLSILLMFRHEILRKYWPFFCRQIFDPYWHISLSPSHKKYLPHYTRKDLEIPPTPPLSLSPKWNPFPPKMTDIYLTTTFWLFYDIQQTTTYNIQQIERKFLHKL